MPARTNLISQIMKLTVCWSLMIKFLVPLGLIIAWFPFITRADSTWLFSPYRPFANAQRDIFSLIENLIPARLLSTKNELIIPAFGLAALCFLVTLICFWRPKVNKGDASLFVTPQHFEWLVPRDTDPNFWDVRKAMSLFGDHAANYQAPVRIRSPMKSARKGYTPTPAIETGVTDDSADEGNAAMWRNNSGNW